MWFGNVNHAQWVPHPAIGMTRTHEGYSETIAFDNGGRFVRRTAASSVGYEMNFPVGDATIYAGIEAFERFASGEYGPDYLHFVDPMWADQNLMPEPWASPGLAEQGWKPIYDSDPIFTDVDPNAYSKPTRAANYTVSTAINTQPTGQNSVCTLLIPPTHTLWFGACGSVSGTAVLRTEAFYTVNRVNLVTNPSSESGVTNIASGTTASGGTHALSIVSTVPFSGADVSRCTWSTASTVTTAGTDLIIGLGVDTGTTANTLSITAGLAYTASFYVRSSVAQKVRCQIQWLNSGGTSVGFSNGSDVTLVAATTNWARVSCVNAVAPAGAVGFRIDVDLGASAIIMPVSSTMDIDGVMMEQSTTLGTYFDGDIPGSIWSDTFEDSASILTSSIVDTALSADTAAPSLTTSFDGAVYSYVQIYITSTLDPTPDITLTSTWAQCLPTGQSPVITRHLPGHGHMGLQWDGAARVENYQLGSRHLVGASMSLVEVEPWD
jgi:hypothetical protein